MSGAEPDPRTRIGEAVVAVVGGEGYEKATVEMIVAEAGVSRAEFDAHFADKEDCYLQVYEEVGREFMTRTGEAFAAGDGWREGMRRTAYATLDWFREDFARARFVTIEPLNAGDRSMAFLDLNLNLLVELVHAGRFGLENPDSVPRSSAEAAVGSIWKMLLGKVRNNELGDDAAVRQLMYIATVPYLGAEAAQEELERPREAGE